MKTGRKTRFLCCQDKGSKDQSKAGANPSTRRRDTLGMHRFPCRSSLTITCKDARPGSSEVRAVSINIRHHDAHVRYYKVNLPDDAAQIIADKIQWSTPSEIVRQVQAIHPFVTAVQVHNAWANMSEVLWKRDPNQLDSAKLLLEEFGPDVDCFIADCSEGVEQICWGMKQIAAQLRGKIVEVGLDATCKSCLWIVYMGAGMTHVSR